MQYQEQIQQEDQEVEPLSKRQRTVSLQMDTALREIATRSFPANYIGYIFPSKHRAKEQINLPSAMVTIELFLDFTCYRSKHALQILKDVIQHYNEVDMDRAIPSVQLRVVPCILPWLGMGGSMLAKAGAVCFLLGGNTLFFDFIDVAMQSIEQFKETNIYQKSEREVWEEMIAKDMTKLLREQKGHGIQHSDFINMWNNQRNTIISLFKHNQVYSAQRAVHATPTVFINGLHFDSIKSDWKVEEYKALIDKLLLDGIAVPPSHV